MVKVQSVLQKIQEAGLQFLVPLTLSQTYKIVTKEAVKLLPGDSGALFIMRAGKLTKVVSYPEKLTIASPRQRGSTYLAYAERKAVVVSAKTLNEIHPEFKKKQYQFAVHIPISYHTKRIGTLTVLTKKKRISQNELQALELFGSYASLAIHKAKLFGDIKEALSSRDLFISIAAHEFRTPLTSINGYIQLLHSRLAKEKTVEARWVQQLQKEGNRLTNLVKELLEINRIKTGTLQFSLKEESLVAIVKNAINAFGFSYPQRKITCKNFLSVKKDTVIADHNKLLQVVINILDNAAKFSSSKTEIQVAITEKNQNFIVTIQDYGTGIAKEDTFRIFQGFYKKIEQKEGMGVGLLLAKHIIAYHHGKIGIVSEPQKGTTIEIILPKAKK